MHRFIILFAASLLLLTGPTNAFAVPVTQEVFDLEFMQYVSAPCMTALLDKAGILDLFTGDERLSEAEQMALFLYRFDKTQLAEFTFHLEHRKIYLSNTVREETLSPPKSVVRHHGRTVHDKTA